MEHTEVKTTDSKYYTCDICGARYETDLFSNIVRCDGCGIDICHKCRKISPRDSYEDFGDYIPFVCNSCNEIFVNENFHQKMKSIQAKIEGLHCEEDTAIEDWRDKCKGKA